MIGFGADERKAVLFDGLGEIRIEYTAELPAGGPNRRLILENNNRRQRAVYLVNALAPSEPGISIVAQKRITYVVGDKRITEQLPAAGYYFSPDPHQGNYKKPLPSQTIDKYNDIPGVSRVFDDGTIVIYDLAGAPK